MLPERLSTDLTSLNDHQDRLAIVVELVVSPDGQVKASDVYGAVVNNKAKLAYNAVGAWLAGEGPPVTGRGRPCPAWTSSSASRIASRRRSDHLRAEHGALGFETIEVENVFDGDTLHEVRSQKPKPREVV